MKARSRELKAARGSKGKADGAMWPTAFALAKLTRVEGTRIAALVKRAVS